MCDNIQKEVDTEEYMQRAKKYRNLMSMVNTRHSLALFMMSIFMHRVQSIRVSIRGSIRSLMR